MFSQLVNWFKGDKNQTQRNRTPELTNKLKIGEREQDLFERAVKLYIFVHHVPHTELEPDLRDQLRYTGNAVYSLLLNWVRDKKPSLEYMDFLNSKLHELRELPKDMLKGLQIMPEEIHLLELQDEARIRFSDEEEGLTLYLNFVKAEGCCFYHIEQH